MQRIAKIYCRKEELHSVAPGANVLENYDAFQLIEGSSATLKKASTKVPVEDITALYKIRAGGRTIEAGRRPVTASARAKVPSHSDYPGGPRLPRGPHHYIVQFIGPIKESWLRAVKKAGGIYRSPLGDFGCIFQLTRDALAKVAALPCVRWVGHLPYESRVAKGVLRPSTPGPGRSTTPLNLSVGPVPLRDAIILQFFDKKAMVQAGPKVADAGGEVLSVEPTGPLLVVKVPPSGPERTEVIGALSRIHGVRLITGKTIPSVRNNIARGIMGTARSTSATGTGGLGLTGTGEIVAVADTGLDTGDAQTVMADFANRVNAIHSWAIDKSFDSYVTNRRADDGPADIDSGHGTHVAGSAVGAGSPGPGGAPQIRSLAPNARLVFQAIEQKMEYVSAQARAWFRGEDFTLTGIPSDLKKLFRQAYNAGARIHSNSWGGGEPGDYDSQSRQLDEFVWQHRDFCILVAAGNDGTDSQPGADGVVNEGSVTPPGTAKNCITIGATENERPEFAGQTYGAIWPSDFPKNPLKSDEIANNRDHLAAFSSRGPTGDGRIKPDLVAPGTSILSTRSTRLANGVNGWSPFPPNPHYMYEGGTSMATPLAAGAAALVREFFRTRQNIARPSAALLKATLICGATRLSLPYVPGNPIADNHQGFGRINLDSALSPPAGQIFGFVDRSAGLRTGQLFARAIAVSGTRSLRVVLVYSDYPGRGLKNNLNLLLTAPDGSRRVGNAPAGSLTFDSVNNVEVIEAANPGPGNWQVQVVAANVPEGPQPFALAWLA